MLNTTLVSLLLALATEPSQGSEWAQAAPSEATSSGSPEAAQPSAPGEGGGAQRWATEYDAARALMVAGRFAEAAERFTRLSRSASNRIDRTLAYENAAICGEWVQRGMALTLGGARAGTHAGLGPDRRTLDELAVLYTVSVLYGLGTGGVVWAFSEADDAAKGVLPMLALAGASAAGVALLDHKLNLRYGVPQSIVSGMMIGLEEGMAWLFWNQARVAYYDEWSEKAVAGLMWGTATAGAIAGGVLGSVYGTTPGRASLVGSAALWSGLVAGLVAGSMGNGSTQDDWALLSAAVALNAGAVAGALVGASTSPSIARVRFIDLGALAGGVLFGGLYLSSGSESAEGMMFTTGAGIVAGLTASWLLTRGMDPDLGPERDGKSSVLSRLVPTIAPTSSGNGLMIGVGATM